MDRRQRKTREAIFSAFSKLLSQKQYNRISVQEIIDLADVGRTTFYAHFETKDYLLKQLCEELFSHIIDSAIEHTATHGHYSDGTAPNSVFLHLIQHLQENDYHILELLASDNNGLFLNYFKSNLKKLITIEYVDKGLLKNSSLPVDYVVNHISSSFVETVSWWLAHGKTETPEQLDLYFQTVMEAFL